MIVPETMRGKTVAVLGLGRSGLSAVEALLAAGAKVFCHDDNVAPKIPTTATMTPTDNWPWLELAALILSPGIPHAFPAPHPAAKRAIEGGIPVISDIELFMTNKPQARVVGITGTNGKSTTTMLLVHLLEQSGIPAIAAGNIGTPVLAINDPGANGVIVVELSSYQLETTPSLNLDAGAIINITPDHLDRHDGWEGYVAAKAILADSVNGLLLLGEGTDTIATNTKAKTERIKDNKNINAAIALRLCQYLGGSAREEDIASFPGLPHRMETICTAGNIRFVNDSKATNAEAATLALGHFNSVYWIAGGRAKDGGLQSVDTKALKSVIAAYLIGESADDFATDLNNKISHRICGTLDRAMRDAIGDAVADNHPDATILLAPAAASFDQFSSFEERGDAFRNAALAWAEEAANV